MKRITLILSLFATFFFAVPVLHAEDAYWNQCGEGTIVRCETYDCPQGDTNRDGRCTNADDNAKLQEAKNDAFCANPLSGCGEVTYFTTNSRIACAVRVKESRVNCDLYKASTPQFATQSPSPTTSPNKSPAPTSTPRPTQTPTATVSATTKGGQELPKTGAALWVSMVIAAIGVYGLYIAERGKN